MNIIVGRTQETEMKKLELKRNDILCIKRPKHMRDPKFSELLTMFADDLVNFLGFNTIIIGVDRNWNEITKLSEEQMKLYGWVPRGKVLAMKGDPVDKIWEAVKELKDFAKINDILMDANTVVGEEE